MYAVLCLIHTGTLWSRSGHCGGEQDVQMTSVGALNVRVSEMKTWKGEKMKTVLCASAGTA